MIVQYRSLAGRTMRVLPALFLLALVLAPQEAAAYHEGVHLEVTPEVQEVPVGSAAVLTAVLVGNDGFSFESPSDLEVLFENMNGANDPDRTDGGPADASCVIAAGSSTCKVEWEAITSGRALYRAWFGTADMEEGRFASSRDCRQLQDEEAECTTMETGTAPIAGTTCPSGTPPTSTQLPGEEPDCTDVLEVNFTEAAAGTLDCDDSTGPDTEHESNPNDPPPSTTGDDPSIERYTCTVRDEFGNRKPGVPVFGEVISGVNDPDNGAVYTSPDYECEPVTTGQPRQTREDDPLTTDIDEKGTCPILVEQSEDQMGTATICFWVGSLSDGVELCPSEEVGAASRPDGSDEGNNNVDLAQLTWESVSDLVLDCIPETGFSLVNSIGKVECTALSTVTDGPVQGIKIMAEAVGANDPDDSDSPQTPDFHEDESPVSASCTTASNGKCSIEHQGTDAGETTYRAWINDGNDSETTGSGAATRLAIDYDPTEGRDEKQVPGTTGEPDATDVVISDWGQGPTNITATPKSGAASIGDCHEITLAATDKDGNAAGGVRIDVEQQHENFRNSTPNDEPIVGFCTPLAGPNPSDVDTTAGDLQPAGDRPNTSGTAGGETVGFTDLEGRITIGVMTQGARGSSGAGTVYVTSWWETTDNDDPGGGEPSDTSMVTWSPGADDATLELTPDISSADVGGETTYTATVTQNDQPVAGVEIAWSMSGVGSFAWNESVTDSAGQATATVTSAKKGSSSVTATCEGTFICSDTSTQNWGPAFCDFVGTEGDDVLTGTDAPETLCGFAGDDVIEGGGGNDILLGAGGNDRLLGGDGDDELMGGGGKDRLIGGQGTDALYGGSSTDRLSGGPGADTLNGGSGDDALSGGTGPDELVGGKGDDALRGNKGRDSCRQGATTTRPKRC